MKTADPNLDLLVPLSALLNRTTHVQSRSELDEIQLQLDTEDQLVAAGTLDTGSGRFAIKVPGLFENINDILDMPLKTKDDAVVRIRDIASIRRTFKDRRSYARVNGRPAISLDISKRTGENIIETITLIRALVKEEAASWPRAATPGA